MHLTLNTYLDNIKGIGPRYAEALAKKNILKVKDLLFYFPFRYENFSKEKAIRDLHPGEKVTITGKLKSFHKKVTFRRRMSIIEGIASDDTASLKIIWFNQPYLTNSLNKGEVYRMSGKVDYNNGFMTLTNPAFEKIDSPSINTAGLLPVYHEDYIINSRFLRRVIFPLLPLSRAIPETLPEMLLKNYKLMGLSEAIREIHHPSSEIKRTKARERLAFEELFLIQLYLGQKKFKWRKNTAPVIDPNVETIKKFVNGLPFKLTDAQRRSSWEIVQDLTKRYPMNRLLEGDVGSGKTIVAAIAALITAKSKNQVVMLAPTEILAMQHFKSLKNLFKGFFKPSEIGIFTRSNKKVASGKCSKKEFLKRLNLGKIKIIAATHAILQKEIKLRQLGLVIIDEQHRFGVAQRSHLQNQISALGKKIPHLLSMSATPIPRTLALAIYSDLELSILNELPKGRQKIITKIVAQANRRKMYDFIRAEINKGRQAFVICPLIEDKDNEDGAMENYSYFLKSSPSYQEIQKREVKAVKKESELLKKKIFPEFKVAMLHGKMKGEEKNKIMQDFKKLKSHILVSTSVIEVGIDIPNATIMLIEGAERFGLAQLHQFRGRVGRGEHQSFCFLLLSEGGIRANKRLEALVKNYNGLKLAEEDLKLRGPGDFIGIRQSGLPDLTMANLSDGELIKIARGAASLILSKSPGLNEFPTLKTRLKSFMKKFHRE